MSRYFITICRCWRSCDEITRVANRANCRLLSRLFPNAHLYLFGSRVDDAKKGGDIDLFVESSEEVPLKVQMDFLKALYKDVTQLKVDLVVQTPSQPHKPIFKIAKETGVRLC